MKKHLLATLLFVATVFTACVSDKPASISINASKTTITIGEISVLEAIVLPSGANQDVTWSSSDENIATVKDGVVTGVNTGKVSITATSVSGGAKGSCSINVANAEPQSVLIDGPKEIQIIIGSEHTLKASILPEDASQDVIWSSPHKLFFSIDENGVITAKALGTARIIAKIPGKDITTEISVTVVERHFPDVEFCNYLKSLGFVQKYLDINPENETNKAKFAETKELIINEKEIKSLKGIEYFTALTKCEISWTKFTSIDLSKNTSLKAFICKHNNNIELLDLSYHLQLEELTCNQNKNLKELKTPSSLKKLDCNNNELLSSLDMSQSTMLSELNCSKITISSLDLSKNTTLKELDCSENKDLRMLNLSNNTMLEEVICKKTMINSLDVSENIELITLDCSLSPIRNIKFSNNRKLSYLDCSGIFVMSFDISGLSGLTYLDCTSTDVGYDKPIDLSGNPELKVLKAGYNLFIKEIDLSRNPKLMHLTLKCNFISELDLSNNIELTELICSDTNISALDFINNKKLETLICNNSCISELDISKLNSIKIDLLKIGNQHNQSDYSQINLILKLSRKHKTAWDSVSGEANRNVTAVVVD